MADLDVLAELDEMEHQVDLDPMEIKDHSEKLAIQVPLDQLVCKDLLETGEKLD